jgi:hypothetical protein
MANIAKLNIDNLKATVQQLYTAVVNATDDINEKLFLHGQTKRQLQIQPMAHGSEFYVPNIFWDRILLTTNGNANTRGWGRWADQELVNNKPGWEALEIVSSSLSSGTYYDQ